MKTKLGNLGLTLTAGLLITGLAIGPAQATPQITGASSAFTAKDDSYLTAAGRTVHGQASLLANDKGATALVSHTDPTHGALTVRS